MSEEANTEIRNLKCDLSREDVHSRAEQVAILVGELDDLETDRKDANDVAKKEIQTVQTTIGTLSRQVRERAEYRDVECWWHRDEPEKVMALVRKDTGEIVWSRPLTERELQVQLFPVTEPAENPFGSGG